MTWIKTIDYEKAKGRLKKIYDRVKGADNRIDNILMAHSLRPHSLEGHLALYKNVLHHNSNQSEKWFLETVGVYVSLLNQCDYCVQHHYCGLKRLLDDEENAEKIFQALENRKPELVFDQKQSALLHYAGKLTLDAASLQETDISDLHKSGCEDGEILEINQVAAYFNYANRTILGLGVTTKGDILGLSPNNDDDDHDWSHR